MGGGRRKKSKKQSKGQRKLASLGRAPKSLGGPTKAQNLAKARIAAKKTATPSASSGKTSGVGPVSSGKAYATSLGNKRVTTKPKSSGSSFSTGVNNNLGITSKSIKASTPTGTPSQFSRGTSGIGPVASGDKYASMLSSAPKPPSSGTLLAGAKTGFGLRPDGVTGEYKEGDVFNTGGKSGVDYKYQGEPGKGAFVKLAGLPKWMTRSVFGEDPAGTGKKYLDNVRDQNAADETKGLKNFFQNIKERDEATGDQSSLSSPTFGLTASTSPMAIQTYGTGGLTEDASSASGYSEGGNPLTKTDAMSSFGIGGLNLDNLGGTERAVNNITSEQLADRYNASLNPNSFKGLSDGVTSGVGPVASGDAYARGLNTDNQNVENRLRQVRNLGSTLTGGLIPPVRKLADKEIADRRIKNAAFREANLKRGGGSGGARLTQPTVPTVQEELLLPVEQPVQTASTTGTTQTGVDTNRLLQIQQQAYQQSYNPMSIGGFNPQFRFASRTPRIDYSTYFNYS